MYIKNSIRIVYGENFKSFTCTLTDVRLSERSEGHTGWPIINATELKIEYLHYDSSKGADFFTSDRGMYKLYIHKDMP